LIVILIFFFFSEHLLTAIESHVTGDMVVSIFVKILRFWFWYS